ncbi:MAG: glycosyltransferase [Desulfobacterales bacterium]|nr:glycosyltransferase [Desulfobacterales bacterium]
MGLEKQISVVIVNFNGLQYLERCLQSLRDMDSGPFNVDIIMVDNCSTDNSMDFVGSRFPEVKIIKNDRNNFAKALNLGIQKAEGDFVALLNNDMTVEKNWLLSAMEMFLPDEHIGAVQSKIRFMENGRINSAGVEEVEDFYFRDIGFDEKDSGQYDQVRELQYFSGGAVFLRMACIADVGDFDEDFIMYCEDVDYSIRCRQNGWKIFYAPKSEVLHKYQGSASSALCEYFCSRNRLFCMAKHIPEKLPAGIRQSHIFLKGEKKNLYRVVLQAARKLVISNKAAISNRVLDRLKQIVQEVYGPLKAYHFFSRLELLLQFRSIRIGIYDHAFHFAGGGQRYVATMAEMLQDTFDITYIANKDISLEKYREWFGLNLSGCRLKVLKIPFFEARGRYFIDEGMVINEETNPFEIISKESVDYDIFINANMLGKVRPLSPLSVFVCHFPDRDREAFFQVDKYDFLISNGDYTGLWLKKRWGLAPTHRIYPPVDMYNGDVCETEKEKIILSVARFEVGGSKKQIEMINAFLDLKAKNPELLDGWRLCLAGGNFPKNSYYQEIKNKVRQCKDIELMPDVSHQVLKDLYARASIFWHACGLNETSPHLIEHFGMTTVEAMQNKCVPVVFDGGGQKEIIRHGQNGFRFQNIFQLQQYTLELIKDGKKYENMAAAAYTRSHDFNANSFGQQIESFFSELEYELCGVDSL